MFNTFNLNISVNTPGRFDQFGRELPLSGHDIDCKYSKFGLGLCTCTVENKIN